MSWPFRHVLSSLPQATGPTSSPWRPCTPPRNPLYCPNVAISPFLAPRDTCFAHSEKIQAQSTRDKCGQSSRFRLSTLPDSRPLPRGPTLLHDPECIASLCSSVLEEGSSLNGGGLQSQGQDLPRALSKGSHYHCSRNK